MMFFANPTAGTRDKMLERDDFGAIVTPAQGNVVDPGIPVCIDNGCFTNPEAFTPDGYWKLCEQYPHAVFATAPDIVGNWEGTLHKWNAFAHPQWPVPLAICLQDGATPDTIPRDADAVFVGGTTEWKLSAAAADCVAWAKDRGMWAHMGRVNSYKRLDYARWIGCDSADGTYLVFGPDINLPKLLRWLDRVNTTDPLFTAQKG